ncbi:protein kinase [Nostoc sp. CHAB 5844]|nr:protein kinase [Nostoc sp. CHAB 5844]
MIGQILGGNYQIQAQLGKGGFGITFTAIDLRRPGNPQCIVKQFKPVSTDPNTLAVGKRLFDTEAEKLERLGHYDQIPRLLAFFQENQEFYLVQEYIEGHDLTQELIPGEKLREREVIKLLEGILEVLTFVHQQKLIHRDLKPSNIRRRRADGKIVLIDFGAVKEVTTQVVSPIGIKSLTVAIGTPGYMPSEQAKGQPTFHSDIYAVGIIAIQALTGINPCAGGVPTDPQTGEFVWRDRAQVSSKLANIIDKMVRYDYRQRYPSAAEALQAIRTLSPKSSPWKLWLSVGLVIAITPLIFWFFSRAFNSKPNFVSYANHKKTIKIQYPQDWNLQEQGGFEGDEIKIVPGNNKTNNSCYTNLIVNVSDLSPQLLSRDEYKNIVLKRLKNNEINQQIQDKTQPQTTLSKQAAYKLTYTRQEEACKYQVMEIGTVRNGKAYYITYIAPVEHYSNSLPVAESIINSFEITETQE